MTTRCSATWVASRGRWSLTPTIASFEALIEILLDGLRPAQPQRARAAATSSGTSIDARPRKPRPSDRRLHSKNYYNSPVDWENLYVAVTASPHNPPVR
jgi:hypothetical protein